jgi:hypothetical protein
MLSLRSLYCGFSPFSLILTDELAGCARSTWTKRIALRSCKSRVIVSYSESSYLGFLLPAMHTRSRHLRTFCWWQVMAPTASSGSCRSHASEMIERPKQFGRVQGEHQLRREQTWVHFRWKGQVLPSQTLVHGSGERPMIRRRAIRTCNSVGLATDEKAKCHQQTRTR